MPEKTMRDAINEALHQAMEQDDSVFVIGEDVAGCSGSAGDVGAVGGVFGVTEGIYHRWPDRCRAGRRGDRRISRRALSVFLRAGCVSQPRWSFS